MKATPRGFVVGIVALRMMVCGFDNAPRCGTRLTRRAREHVVAPERNEIASHPQGLDAAQT